MIFNICYICYSHSNKKQRPSLPSPTLNPEPSVQQRLIWWWLTQGYCTEFNVFFTCLDGYMYTHYLASSVMFVPSPCFPLLCDWLVCEIMALVSCFVCSRCLPAPSLYSRMFHHPSMSYSMCFSLHSWSLLSALEPCQPSKVEECVKSLVDHTATETQTNINTRQGCFRVACWPHVCVFWLGRSTWMEPQGHREDMHCPHRKAWLGTEPTAFLLWGGSATLCHPEYWLNSTN